jgi:hypothetical protein
MRRIAVIGPTPPCGALSGERFVEMLAARLEIESFLLSGVPGLMLAPSPVTRMPLPANAGPAARIGADTLVWLRFSPRAYLRDWLAGWLDVLLNGARGARRRASRAHFADVLRACGALMRPSAVDPHELDDLRSQVLFIELSSPEQALFWLRMQEERVRETRPPRI